MPALRASHVRLAIVALGMSGALAVGAVPTYEAWRASRDHRAAAERTLHEYAGFAVRSYAQMVQARIYFAVTSAFRALGQANDRHPHEAPPTLAVLRGSLDEWLACDCGSAVRPDHLFRYDPKDGALTFDGPRPAPSRRAWLASEARKVARWSPDHKWNYMSAADTLSPGLHFAYFTVWRGGDGVPLAVYGFDVTADALREAVLLRRTKSFAAPLLPVAGAERVPTDSLLSIAVVDSSEGRAYLVSRHAFPLTYAATVPSDGALGELWVRVAINPAVADRLLAGGLPPSRTPLLVALSALAAALLVTLVALTVRAMELARLRAEFVASVSHELRTPLAQILLFAESVQLGRMRTRKDVQRASDVIVTETRRLMQLVGNLLLFGRTARGAFQATRTPTALAPLVREVLDGFAPLAGVVEARVRTLRVDDVVAPADGDALRQVLLNLLDNAVKYGPPGQTIGVGVALVDGRARLWVEDEGPGIAPADRARAWQPFVRLRRDVEGAAAGSGIGLAVVREIVAQHGGAARIESTPAGGACIVIELPDARERSAAERLADDRTPAARARGGADDEQPDDTHEHETMPRDATLP